MLESIAISSACPAKASGESPVADGMFRLQGMRW